MENILETKRLFLREVQPSDFDAWYKILSDEETMKYYPSPFSKEKVIRWINWNLDNYKKYGFGLWSVILKETGECIGDCGITMQDIYHNGTLYPELGFHINKLYWQKGYASEAARAVLDYIFKNTNYEEIFCYQKSTNFKSQKIALKIGMILRNTYKDDINDFTTVYSITKQEYIKG